MQNVHCLESLKTISKRWKHRRTFDVIAYLRTALPLNVSRCNFAGQNTSEWLQAVLIGNLWGLTMWSWVVRGEPQMFEKIWHKIKNIWECEVHLCAKSPKYFRIIENLWGYLRMWSWVVLGAAQISRGHTRRATAARLKILSQGRHELSLKRDWAGSRWWQRHWWWWQWWW